MLKPLVSMFRLDLSARLKGIAEKQVPAKLKPIVGSITCTVYAISRLSDDFLYFAANYQPSSRYQAVVASLE